MMTDCPMRAALLSILIPLYNEEEFIEKVIDNS